MSPTFTAPPITSPDTAIRAALIDTINHKTKPVGALGRLESLALQIGWIQQSLAPALKAPHLYLFAADHGIVAQGVSCYPSEVTQQMVLNFLRGGAAANVFARESGVALTVVDAGINAEPIIHPNCINRKIARGTQNFAHTPAMRDFECAQALQQGVQFIADQPPPDNNVVLFGEMGIGNTTSASAMVHLLTGIALSHCVGRGTGLSDEGVRHKCAVIESAIALHQKNINLTLPMNVLQCFGGFEIAMMAGAILGACAMKKLVVVDGFIATAAWLLAHSLQPTIRDYSVFAHQSEEQGHGYVLRAINAEPLLSLGLRLGEGSGALLAYPLIRAAVAMLHGMASFKSAQVSTALTPPIAPPSAPFIAPT